MPFFEYNFCFHDIPNNKKVNEKKNIYVKRNIFLTIKNRCDEKSYLFIHTPQLDQTDGKG